MSNRTIEHLEIVADFLDQMTDRDSYAVYVRGAAAEIARLQAIVQKLPKTADGVPICPGDKLYFTFGPTLCTADSYMELRWPIHQVYSPGSMTSCYSTREAAEAAREQK